MKKEPTQNEVIRSVCRFLPMLMASLLMMSVLSYGAFARDTIKLSEDPWDPYTLGHEGETPTGGIAVELMNEIFKRVDIATDMKLFPWERCLAQMKTGKRDALMLLTKNAERELFLDYSEVIMTDNDLIWYRKSSQNNPADWVEFSDLKNYVIGESAGYNYGDVYSAAREKHKFIIDKARTDLLNFRKLQAGRIDIFICNETAAKAIFKNNPYLQGRFLAASKSLKTVEFHMAFSKESPLKGILPQVNQAIQEMKSDGTIERILVK